MRTVQPFHTNFLQPPSAFVNRDEAGSQDHRLSIGLQGDASVEVEEDEIRPLRARRTAPAC